MNELVDNEKRFSDDVKFSYDTLTRKVTVHLQNGAELYFVTLDMCWDFHQKKIFPNPLPPKEKLT